MACVSGWRLITISCKTHEGIARRMTKTNPNIRIGSRSHHQTCRIILGLFCRLWAILGGTVHAESLMLENGNWFDGQGFRTASMHVQDGLFTDKPLGPVDQVIDLQGGYVIPPFADAHCHHFDSVFNIREMNAKYLKDGVYYAKVQTNSRAGAVQVASEVNKPDRVDVKYAHGGLTSSFGHGVEIYEGLALFYRTGGFDQEQIKAIRGSKQFENDAYFTIDSRDELEKKWPSVLAGKPDFIKLYLVDSGNYAQQLLRTDTVGDRGIDPLLTVLAVEKAHAAGLEVSAHVDTVFDLRTAVAAGVDELAHLPGYFIRADDQPQRYELADDDAAAVARNRVRIAVCPVAFEMFDPKSSLFDARSKEITDRVRRTNLEKLKQAGAQIIFGSDRYGDTPVADVLYLAQQNVWTPLELLKIWCEETPTSIFPKRKIGKLEPGFEASLVVLEKNPLEDVGHLQMIRRRMKQGKWLD